MADPAFAGTTMTPEVALMTAQQFAEQAASLTRAAQVAVDVANFLRETGGILLASADITARHPSASPLPSGVADISAYRSRRQAVQR
ncbi:hypothetical protein [Nonomuraea sp. GTA35]|uniref:hypothetical protein n=1 Tax=Nonomuraea sp. GTA35 TaxID=1676746 RepID=UPI0035C1373A